MKKKGRRSHLNYVVAAAAAADMMTDDDGDGDDYVHGMAIE